MLRFGRGNFWLGSHVQKNPLDLWVFQEIIWDRQPDIIIETGTANGGATLFMASVCDLMNSGQVLSIDIDDGDLDIYSRVRVEHKRIKYFRGRSSIDNTLAKDIKKEIPYNASVMVDLDSNHDYDHVLKEMEIYGDLVTPGQYMIVEDTNCWGPNAAVVQFLRRNHNFELHKHRELAFTWNPDGYLFKREI